MTESFIQETPPARGSAWALGLILLALFAFAGVLLCTAWLSDDAFISFRVSDNLVHGYGLRWNTAERVQSYTNPLWMLLVAGVYTLTREMYYTPMLLGMGLTLIAMVTLTAGLRRTPWAMLAVVLLFMTSRPFVDYATSGLENPLTHLLLAVFFVLLFRAPERLATLFCLSFLAHLCMVNRMDTILLTGPSLAWAWWRQRSWKALAAAVLGMTPFLAWELFSLLYYGFPFPNTGYAKLGAGLSRWDLLKQGAGYFENSLRTDHVTLPVILLTVGTALALGTGKGRCVALGITAYLAYVVWAGGDFMSGRFFATPLFCAAALLVQTDWFASPKRVLWAFLVLLVLSPYVPNPTAYLGSQQKASLSLLECCDHHGIADERGFYYLSTGLVPHLRGVPFLYGIDNAMAGKEVAEHGYTVVQGGAVGFLGFFAGPTLFVIDSMGLGDSLMARLPARYYPVQRPGHYMRHVPPGYARVLQNPQAALDDARLTEYLTRLWAITRGPLWSLDRWKTILAMNLGRYDGLIDKDAFQFPLLRHTTLSEVNARKDMLPIEETGIEIALESPPEGNRLTLQLDADDRYDVLFMRKKTILGKMTMGPAKNEFHGMTEYSFSLPQGVESKDCTSIRIIPWIWEYLFWITPPRPPENNYFAMRSLRFGK